MIDFNELEIYRGEIPFLTFSASGRTFGIEQDGNIYRLLNGIDENGEIIRGKAFSSLSAAIAAIEALVNGEDIK
jgi:hypothetical protein